MNRPAAVCTAVLALVMAGGQARADQGDGGGYWAFRTLSAPSVPRQAATGAGRTSVDAFVVARLGEKGLRLSPEADRLTLLRRASYDLTGLPPMPAEIDVFLSDPRSDAYERLVDRLLASPHFGERWGRHWLDAAGYSDITGGDNDAGIIKLSEGKWKYRDYVVRAMNEDKPYDRFLVEQLAGDELVDWRSADSFTPEVQELLIATGFLRSAADDTDEKELTTPDILNGVLQRTSEVLASNLLGLTLGCAKCHDHKYEPIAQREYYSLSAVLTPAFNPAAWLPPKQRALADIPPKIKAEAEKHNAEIDRQVAELKAQSVAVNQRGRERVLDAKVAGLPEAIRADVKTAGQTAADKRSEVQKYLADKFAASLAANDQEIVGALTAAEKTELVEFGRRSEELKRKLRTWGTIQATYDVGPPPVTYLLVRGNHETPGAVVEPGFLEALCAAHVAEATVAETVARSAAGGSAPVPAGATSGRRLALARWITDWRSPSGALAARVLVNRVWQHLFGRGIVETSENLGVSGSQPTHPELLEWLSARFVAEGRHIKPLVRLLMTSAVYRQSSHAQQASGQSAGEAVSGAAAGHPDGEAASADPGNYLLSRMPLRRLEAESVRDAILSTSGQLDLTLGGPPLPLETRPDGSVVIQEKGSTPAVVKSRRSLYVLARRNYHLSILNVFDQPAMSTNCPHRQQSAVVLQSLTMLNDEFVLDQAGHFARRVRATLGDAPAEAQIDLVFRIALGRSPTAPETQWSKRLLLEHAAEYAAAGIPADEVAGRPLAHLCHMLLNSNEFLYIQ